MKGTPAVYLGRIVTKENFRVVVYSPDGQKRLVKSWNEFEAAMASGLWFATVEAANDSKELASELGDAEGDATPSSKPKSKRGRQKAKPVYHAPVEEVGDENMPVESDDMVFEVTDENR